MPFVNETLSESDKEYFASFGFKAPLTQKLLARTPVEWAVDKENKYYLVCLGGQGYTMNEEYPPYYYRLIIDNVPIKIVARCQSMGDFQSGVKMKWYIQAIYLPEELKSFSEEKLLRVVKEAFVSHGNIDMSNRVISTEFGYINPPCK